MSQTNIQNIWWWFNDDIKRNSVFLIKYSNVLLLPNRQTLYIRRY